MFGAVRAVTAAVFLLACPRRRTLFARPAPPKVRRLAALEAAMTFAPAELVAQAASLWTSTMTGQCLVAPRYGAAVVRFGQVVRLTPAAGKALAPPPRVGVAALYDQLRAAGFVVADEAEAHRLAEAPRRPSTVVRVLQDAPMRPRRAVLRPEGTRVAA
ncbi:MAG: hypothetical protein ACOYKM_10605 [Caulobacterales bacterium]|jgi:hypothetical protein